MNAADIRDLLQREPFQPIRVILTSGTHYDVRDPQLVMPLKRELFIAFDDGDRWTLVPYLHIAGVELLGNGRRPARRKRRT
jgi:hypothetical protein